uniref:Uncharacterized protein n=1 Tax=viral metagenome TaxID=1070528 RepID=A0A6M3L1P5_9ZZZZ
MGRYYKRVRSAGGVTAASATDITLDIPGSKYGELAILAFWVTASESATADKLYFMKSLATTTMKGAMASGVSTVTLAALPALGSNAIASGDLLAIQMDDDTYHFTLLSGTSTTSVWAIGTALDDTVASGNAVYWLGLYSDTGHFKYQLTASTQSTKELASGLFYSGGKGYPMRVFHDNAGSVPGRIDLVTWAYV